LLPHFFVFLAKDKSMALDLMVIDMWGKPLEIVPISQFVHDELMLLVAKHNFFQLSRLSDFYLDVTFEYEHIPLLKYELKILKKEAVSKELRSFVKGILKLTEYACRYHKQIEAIAD
jgi:hypothetical protein